MPPRQCRVVTLITDGNDSTLLLLVPYFVHISVQAVMKFVPLPRKVLSVPHPRQLRQLGEPTSATLPDTQTSHLHLAPVTNRPMILP